MATRILVALDGSPAAEHVIPLAADAARAAGATVRLVHVASLPEGRVVADTDQEIDRVDTEQGQYLRALADAHFAGLPVACHVRFGDPVEQILEEAEAFDADLIAVATPTRSNVSRAWLGSVAEELVRRAPVTVMLLRPTAIGTQSNGETNERIGPAADVPSSRRILEMASAFQTSRLLLTACELGVFNALDRGPMTSIEVAQVIRAEPRATDRLMNALCAKGLLEKVRGRFANTPSAARWLVEGKPEFLANLLHTAHLWETWSTLTEAVRQGRAPMVRPPKARDAVWLRAFIAAMHWRASQQAPVVVAALDLSDVSCVLDVGGGSGAYAMAFAQARADLQAVVFDLPGVVPLAQEYIARGGFSDRVRAVAGDYDVDALGSAFDLVFLSAILHGNNPVRNQALLRKSAAALAVGGRVVVQDFIMDEDRIAPAFGALFALNMLVGTDGGDAYTESEVREWMAAAGLADIVRKDTPFGTSLIIGRKNAISG